MDNLPKKSGDWTSFTGKYPTDKAGPAAGGTTPPAAPVPPAPPLMQAVPVASPFEPKAATPLAPDIPSPTISPSAFGTPAAIPAPPLSTSLEPAPFVTTPVETPGVSSGTFTAPAVETSLPPIATPAADANPFIIQETTTTPPKKSGSGRRLIAVIILIIALLGIGFVAFKVIGNLLAQGQPVTLTYWGLWENEQILTPVIAEYKKTHPKIEIVYSKQSPKQYRERLQAALARGDGPDIFRFHNTWVPMLKDDLAPAGKTGYTAGEFQQIFYPVATSDLVIGGKVYGAPLMFDGLGLYYNEDLVRAAGVTPPTTWEEFRQAALTLTVRDSEGHIITAGAALGTAGNIEHFSEILGVMMLQNGVNLKNPVSKEAQDALSFYRLFAEKPNNVWDETLDNSILAFAGGRVAMIFAPSWQVFTIKEINPDLKFQIIPIPQLPGTSVAWASYWTEGVSSKSKQQEAAWEFVKFLTSKESEIILYTEASKDRLFGEPYSRVDLSQTITSDPYVGAYIRQAPIAQTFFVASRTFDNGLNDRMIKYVEDAINSTSRGVSNEAALDTMAKGFSQVLSSLGSTSTAP